MTKKTKIERKAAAQTTNAIENIFCFNETMTRDKKRRANAYNYQLLIYIFAHLCAYV